MVIYMASTYCFQEVPMNSLHNSNSNGSSKGLVVAQLFIAPNGVSHYYGAPQFGSNAPQVPG
tara:strand:- start:233 stop:418 length:186 start_codon:yes stop_codon:yes gene_type:complete